MPEKIKHIIVKGSPNSRAKVILRNAAGNTYNQSTRLFESGTNFVNISVGLDGRAVLPVFLPEITSNDTYTLSVKPIAGVSTDLSLLAKEDYITKEEYPSKTITWTTSHSTAGYTIASTLSTSFDGDFPEKPFSPEQLDETSTFLSLTGAISKSSALLYVTRQPTLNSDGIDGDFTNSRYVAEVTKNTSPSQGKITVADGTNVIDGLVVFGGSINEKITVTKDATILTLVGYSSWPTISNEETLYYTTGGHVIEVQEAEISGSGTTSLTATCTGNIKRFGYDDVTITWALENNVTTIPNASNISASCPEGGTIEVNCGAGDTDSNAGSKSYSRVAGPSKGTVGNNSTAFDNNTFTGSTITYNNTSGTGTDTFTFKCNDGTTDSATKTVTITLT